METNNNIEKLEKLEKHFYDFMMELGLDLTDASLKDTPRRVAKMFRNETCRSLISQMPNITSFPNDKNYSGMVLVKDIEVHSLCEHHFQPIIGKAHIAYFPKDRVIGLSKFARIVDFFSKRPQVQERLTQEIFNALKEILGTEDVAVIIDAEHFCMKLRGVEDPCSSTTTDVLGGRFLEESTKNQLFTSISRKC